MSPKYSSQTEAGRPQPNYSNTHPTSLPAKNVNSPQVSPYQVKIPLAFLLLYMLQVLLPLMSVFREVWGACHNITDLSWAPRWMFDSSGANAS